MTYRPSPLSPVPADTAAYFARLAGFRLVTADVFHILDADRERTFSPATIARWETDPATRLESRWATDAEYRDFLDSPANENNETDSHTELPSERY